jgi:hypothetical protein
MRFGNSLKIKFQLQEVLIICGTVSHGLWDSHGLGVTLIALGVLGGICRAAFETAEKRTMAEAKVEDAAKIKSATSALSEAFAGLGGSRSGEG